MVCWGIERVFLFMGTANIQKTVTLFKEASPKGALDLSYRRGREKPKPSLGYTQ